MYRQGEGSVVLFNDSKYSARNPGVRVELVGIGALRAQLPGWQVVATANQIGATALQWDGGVHNIVHGNWARTLPQLDLSDAALYGDEDPALKITLVADGVKPRTTVLPVRVLSRDDYTKYSEQRAAPQPDA
jgi:hypothetical protein